MAQCVHPDLARHAGLFVPLLQTVPPVPGQVDRVQEGRRWTSGVLDPQFHAQGAHLQRGVHPITVLRSHRAEGVLRAARPSDGALQGQHCALVPNRLPALDPVHLGPDGLLLQLPLAHDADDAEHPVLLTSEGVYADYTAASQRPPGSSRDGARPGAPPPPPPAGVPSGGTPGRDAEPVRAGRGRLVHPHARLPHLLPHLLSRVFRAQHAVQGLVGLRHRCLLLHPLHIHHVRLLPTHCGKSHDH